jgi:F0F1-type ATP synthase assembly protein I
METSVAPQAASAAATGVSGFVAAHPIGVALIGGALVGVGVYYLMKSFSKPKEESAA